MTGFVLTSALMVIAPVGDEKLVPKNVFIVFGDPKVDDKIRVSGAVIVMDDKGKFHSDGALLGHIDFEEFVSDRLKERNVLRCTIELDFPETTPAPILLDIIQQIQKGVKDGKRVELTIRYAVKEKKK